MFSPRFGDINAEVILSALGHAFFTLSLGMGVMISYGSYLGREINLLRTASVVVVMDTGIALLAGLAIFPIVFANQLDPSQGPGLIFITLPVAFGQMGGGLVIGVIFFSLLTFAALTSAMSLLEPVVELLEEKTPLNRAFSTIISGAVTWLLGIAALLSFNEWDSFKIFGLGIFDFLDTLTGKFMLPLAGLGVIIFVGWFMHRKIIREELHLGNTGELIWQIVARFIAPIGVIIVFVSQLLELLNYQLADILAYFT
ncbi:MAG: hypothetical protein CR975_03730 [Gammaproteobacteria bacterium]|nr:MAG: hypothetical protein CR975_03730 [Gammaproteobacteria bacterium]